MVRGIILIGALALFSQDCLGHDTSSVKRYAADIRLASPSFSDTLVPVDTSIKHFHRYNPAYRGYFDQLFLGNLGTAHKPLVYQPARQIGFDPGFHQFDLYRFDAEGVKYYDAKSPFTSLFYVLGLQQEQFFQVTHTQNITPDFNVGFDYQRLSAGGFYKNQSTDNANLNAFLWYAAPKKPYNLWAGYIYNKIRVAENGGVADDLLFAEDANYRRTVDVNLQDDFFAEDEFPVFNRWKESHFHMQQSYDWGKEYQEQINDSTVKEHFYGKIRLSHRANYSNRNYLYHDLLPVSGFYDSIYLDSLLTYDYTYFQSLNNAIVLESLGNKSQQPGIKIYQKHLFRIGLHHQYFKLQQNPWATGQPPETEENQNWMAAASLKSHDKARQPFLYEVSGRYIPEGYNKGEWLARLTAGYRLSDTLGIIGLGVLFRQNRPAYLMLRQFSNHFIWDHDYGSITESDYFLTYANERWQTYLKAAYGLMDGWVYWDPEGIPRQNPDQIRRVMFQLQKNFTWRKWHWENQVVYQEFSDTALIHLPNIVSRHSFYYESAMPKLSTYIQFGIDVRFWSNYYADAYMPATGQFILQDTDLMLYYPVVDLFLNFRVKKARLFLQMSHVNQGFPANGYFAALHYPMHDRSFRFGVSWMFLD